jgi:hypothetical protein
LGEEVSGPSNETEVESLLRRLVESNEKIAKALTQIACAFPSDSDGTAVNVVICQPDGTPLITVNHDKWNR